jgi:DNA-binding transcriptional LysR family regulator
VELRQLEHFVAVAEDGSFTKAARRLSYVQSALSVSVQALERELGVRLFDRTTHRVSLTAAGESLLPAARRTLAAAEETRDVAAGVRGVLRGRLRVGIMQAFAFARLHEAFGHFHRQHPDVQIQMRGAIGGASAMLEELRQGALDIAFVAVVDPPSGVTAVPLESEEMVLAGMPDLMPAGRGRVKLEEIADRSFVDFPVGWAIRTEIDRGFAALGRDRHVTLEVGDVASFCLLLKARLGIGLLPPSLLPTGEQSLRQRPVTPPLGWNVVMATPAGRPPTAAASALAELVVRGSE